MPLHDATEYQFASGHRRARVRTADAGSTPIDLATAGLQYAEYLKTFMGATNTTVSPLTTTAKGAQAVTLTATIPQPEGAPNVTAKVVRTALLHFGSGPVVELSLSADESDAAAGAEFSRLLDNATPADTDDSVAAVAQAFSAGPTGRPDYPAGPIKLPLTPDYTGPTSFALTSPEESVSFRIEASPAAAESTRSAVVGTILGSGVGVARGEDGRPIRYETGGLQPRLSPGRAAPMAAESFGVEAAVRGAAPAPAAGETIVEGAVHGAPVQVRVSATGAKALGEQLLQALNATK